MFDWDNDYDEKCSWCRAGVKHTKKQHNLAVRKEIKSDNDCEDALYRQARRQYDHS